MTLRLGVVRPAAAIEVVAVAEARVIVHEFERRLGDVTVDFRVDGEPVGPWKPLDLAAWPGDVDVVVESGALWGADVPPLTSLFARTVEPTAADVRRRMLEHLGMLPTDRFDDAAIAEWSRFGAIRPTDIWLVARHAVELAVADPAVTGFAVTSPPPALDAAFDEIVETVAEESAALSTQLRRAVAAAEQAQAEARTANEAALRTELEATRRLDQLEAALQVARERAERAELGASLAQATDT